MGNSGQCYSKIDKQLKILYGDKSSDVLGRIKKLTEEWKTSLKNRRNLNMPDQTDAILITYADAIQAENEKPLATLLKFLKRHVGDAVTAVHILPFFPYTSDDGFSITDYCKVREELGDWYDIRKISENYKLMADLVLNHVSKSSPWFEGFIKCDERYKDYFITADPEQDFSKVIRPRTFPLLTPFETKDGTKYVWTTFSPDQVDLNFSNPEVLLEILTVLLTYVSYGARFIRLDAVGFLWKEPGTNCMHLKQTHAIVKLLRAVLDEAAPGTIIITETNVPHEENITYLGNGDEAHMIYQFPLPPLTMFTLQSGNAAKLSQWAKSLESTRLNEYNTYLNFLASHDGIGLRPVEGILDEDEKELLIRTVIENGGRISYKTNKDGSTSPYELNINYMDGITNSSKPKEERFLRFIAAQAIMLSLKGIPGIYYHSLLGSENWIEGVETSGINRRINRQKLDYNSLTEQLEDKSSLRNMVLNAHKKILEVRSRHSAFSPFAHQKVLDISPSIFALERYNPDTKEKIIAMINVTDKPVKLNEPIKGIELLGSGNNETITQMKPYQVAWLLV
jgi:glycosidase